MAIVNQWKGTFLFRKGMLSFGNRDKAGERTREIPF